MKKMHNLLCRIPGIALILIVVFGLASSFLYAQGINLKKEILVYILPDSLEFPNNENADLQIDEISIQSQALKQTMESIRLNVIAKAFPNWTDSDTIRVREDDVRVKLP